MFHQDNVQDNIYQIIFVDEATKTIKIEIRPMDHPNDLRV